MPLVKRKLYVPCRDDECLKIYELLRDRMPSISYISMELSEKGLLIEAYGYESDIRDLWVEIKRIIGPLKEITRRSGLRKYNVSLITRAIRKTFPPRLLAEVLRRMHYTAEYSGEEDAIVTNAPYEEVLKVVEKLVALNEEVGKVAANTSTRYYLVASCTLAELPVEDVLKLSADMGLLTRTESGKWILTKDWRTALEELLKSIKK